jgi:16S rRNA (cytosine1402-N4)-methyltransferase
MHLPILLRDTVDVLNLNLGDIVVDATTNRAGHSIELAKKIGKKGILICIDLDSQALDEAKIFLEANLSISIRPKIFYINDNFRNIKNILENLNIKNIDGLIADLGVSSQEIDISGRGFTFQKEEPLLMTLKDKINKDTLSAEKILNTWDEDNLADIIYYYGDEKYARRIAKHICEFRDVRPIKTTKDLVEIIYNSVPDKYRHQKIHFATKTFQAIRITVNDELKAEEELISSLKDILKVGKKASILTFHSGEDRILKRVVKANKENLKLVKFVDRKDFLIPNLKEIKANPRSRSAKLRVVERI